MIKKIILILQARNTIVIKGYNIMLQIVNRCLAKIITLIIALILILTLIFVCENAFKQVKINFDVKVEQSLGLMIEQKELL